MLFFKISKMRRKTIEPVPPLALGAVLAVDVNLESALSSGRETRSDPECSAAIGIGLVGVHCRASIKQSANVIHVSFKPQQCRQFSYPAVDKFSSVGIGQPG